MPDAFNGYHVWLGIPLDEQPPNHYRLLGIAVFEADPDVIDHAADRQMAHVRTFQGGRHGALSQQILNELSAARLCLLSAEKKTTYDSQLRGKLSTISTVHPLAGQTIPMAVPVAPAIPKAAPVTPRAVPVVPQASPASPVAPQSASRSGVITPRATPLPGKASESGVSKSPAPIAQAPVAGQTQVGAKTQIGAKAQVVPKTQAAAPAQHPGNAKSQAPAANASPVARPVNAGPKVRQLSADEDDDDVIDLDSSLSTDLSDPLLDEQASSSRGAAMIPSYKKVRRQRRYGEQDWKRSAILGFLAAAAVVCLWLLYTYVRDLMQTDEWKEMIYGRPETPPAAQAPPSRPMPTPANAAPAQTSNAPNAAESAAEAAPPASAAAPAETTP